MWASPLLPTLDVRPLAGELFEQSLVFVGDALPIEEFASAGLRQSSQPLLRLLAAKNNVLLTTIKAWGSELPAPGLMSATMLVAVPLLFHSSTPWTPSSAR